MPPGRAFAPFPSVTRGPMDVTKARERMGFEPTPLNVALSDTVLWYDRTFLTNSEVRTEMLREFEDDVLFDYGEAGERAMRGVLRLARADVVRYHDRGRASGEGGGDQAGEAEL